MNSDPSSDFVGIRFSQQILEHFKTWSDPVQIRTLQLPDGRWTLIIHPLPITSEAIYTRVMDDEFLPGNGHV